MVNFDFRIKDIPERIVICGERYSTNLGDGVISDCLQYMIRKLDPEIPLYLIDLSGRSAFNHEQSTKKGLNWDFLQTRSRTWRRFRKLVGWHLFRRGPVTARWQKALQPPGLLIVGGGQLLLDTDLNFPIRIKEVVSMARRAGMQVAFAACGVSPHWSKFAHRFFLGAVCNTDVKFVSVRDNTALQNLLTHFGKSLPVDPVVTVDPAVWAAETYGVSKNLSSPYIGLGIAAPKNLCRQAERPYNFRDETLSCFWVELAKLLAENKMSPALFTNGAPEDVEFLKHIAARLELDGKEMKAVILPQSTNPRMLVSQITQMKALVAHRLHANIIAFALGVPTVGLIWDNKVRQFGLEIGCEEFLVESNQLDAALVASKLARTIQAGVDPSIQERLKNKALDGIQTLLIKSGIQTSSPIRPKQQYM